MRAVRPNAPAIPRRLTNLLLLGLVVGLAGSGVLGWVLPADLAWPFWHAHRALGAGLLLALGLAASLLARQLRIPGLVLFLGIGMLAGSDVLGLLVFTDYDLAEDVASRSSAETNGYLHKRSGSEELLDAIRRVAAGEKVWEARERVGGRDSAIHAALLEDANLTPRELEVLAMKLGRRTNAEIADALHISLNTVKHHVTNIYKKLAKTRNDLLQT